MGLFTNKNKTKVNKKERLKKVLSRLFGFVVVISIIVIGTINGLKDSQQLFGEKLAVVMEYVNELNKDIKEEEIVLNPVAEYSVFQEKANISGFLGYDNLEGALELQTTLSLTDCECGSLLSKYINSKEELLSIKEFTVSENDTFRVVYIYDLTGIKKLISAAGDIIPSKMYITNTYSYSVAENENHIMQVSVTKTETIINQMSKKMSENIVNYLKNIETTENVTNILNTYDNYIFNIINDIAIKTESTLSFEVIEEKGYVNFTI